MTAVRQFRLFLLGVITVAWLAIGGEAVCRFEGNWRLDRLTLTKGPEVPPDPAEAMKAERALVQQITYLKGVDPEWFFLPSAPLDMPENDELRARTAANTNALGQENFIWNSAWLAHPSADFVDFIRQQKTATLFSFQSYDGSALPRYRLYPNNDFSPTPWVTNRWGWLGTDATMHKPPRMIRVGILGDSTSHNMYALNLQSFLEAWAKNNGFDVDFEIFSVGRQGLGRDDELAALKYELGPMGLDYVYEYFAPMFMGDLRVLAKLPPNENDKPPPPVGHQVVSSLALLWYQLLPISALARWGRDRMLGEGRDGILTEPRKRRVAWQLPKGTGKQVVLSEARRSEYFGWLIGRLDAFKATAESIEATPLVSTERLCVWDGMVLDRKNNQGLYDVLNGPLFWPFSYADWRRMANAQNRVTEAWARTNAITVVDIDGRFPKQPDLCSDPWHDVYLGHRMRAWLIFQAILPQLGRDLHTGAVPRANGIDDDRHPYLSKPIERLDRQEWLAKIEGEGASATLAK